jgi:hypothetical protein
MVMVDVLQLHLVVLHLQEVQQQLVLLSKETLVIHNVGGQVDQIVLLKHVLKIQHLQQIVIAIPFYQVV